MGIISKIKYWKHIALNLQEFISQYKYKHYDVKHLPSKEMLKQVEVVRSKDVIRVAFIIYTIAKWKTEELYLAMLKNPRFEPILVPVMYFNSDYVQETKQFLDCIKYLDEKRYPYTVGKHCFDIDDMVNPDIVFYGEPYCSYAEGYQYRYNTHRKSIPIYIPYSFINAKRPNHHSQVLVNRAWMTIVENETVANEMRTFMPNKGSNLRPIGVPFIDVLTKAFNNHADVWKKQSVSKKRIIWAPSHTISGAINSYEQSTFLDIADDMLVLAKKYKDSIQWTFKPHPVLKGKLVEKWGQEKVDMYYDQWKSMDNTQLEENKYIDLFMSSDAMIHDGMSFIVEYMFTEKPVMFLDNGKDTNSLYNNQTKAAFDLHYKGTTRKDIEKFINDVVLGGNDPLKPQRQSYKSIYFTVPNGISACQNIINVILGKDECTRL